jgi:alpha-galactosidase
VKQNAGLSDLTEEGVQRQCDLIIPQDGFDYYCSIDSGWSDEDNGDENGVLQPNTTRFPNMSALAEHLHGRGMKLGLYILPGAYASDADKFINGTTTRLRDVFSDGKVYLDRRTFKDYSDPIVQLWHDSVIRTFRSWGVDYLKLDFIIPGSPQSGSPLPRDTSGSVQAYHRAIMNNGAYGKFALHISWKLNRSGIYWQKWRQDADSLRVDQDINNSGESSLTAWWTVLRTIDYYRQFIVEQTQPDRQNETIMIRPDMDNMFVGNPADLSGISDVQRYSVAIHWVGAGANLLFGSDQTNLDALGRKLQNDRAVYGPNGVAAFTAQYPMQPRNPTGSGIPGNNEAMQLQAWVAGPDDSGSKAVVVLANYGPDPCLEDDSGCTPTYGTAFLNEHLVSARLDDLGIGRVSKAWNVTRVWGGGGTAGADGGQFTITDKIEATLGPGESALYVLTKLW